MRHLVIPLTFLVTGCASTPTHHIGPVTGLACTAVNLWGGSESILSCSQAGVFRAHPVLEQPAPVRRLPSIRPFDIDGIAGPFGSVLLIGGGVPGKSGEVAIVGGLPKGYARRQVANDLVYSVALGWNRSAAVGCADGRALLLKLETLEVLREVHRHTAPCRDVCFSPDGKLLASGGRDGLVIVSPVDGGESMVLQDHTAGVECLAFDGEGLLASGALDGKVRVHEGKSLRRTYQKLGAEVLSLAYGGPEHRQLFAGLADGRILELDPNSARHSVITRVDSAVFSMTSLWDDTLVLGLDGEVRVLDLSKSKTPSAR